MNLTSPSAHKIQCFRDFKTAERLRTNRKLTSDLARMKLQTASTAQEFYKTPSKSPLDSTMPMTPSLNTSLNADILVSSTLKKARKNFNSSLMSPYRTPSLHASSIGVGSIAKRSDSNLKLRLSSPKSPQFSNQLQRSIKPNTDCFENIERKIQGLERVKARARAERDALRSRRPEVITARARSSSQGLGWSSRRSSAGKARDLHYLRGSWENTRLAIYGQRGAVGTYPSKFTLLNSSFFSALKPTIQHKSKSPTNPIYLSNYSANPFSESRIEYFEFLF